ncbi:hypothetical protein [Aidingimonas lacisalsi]|uniref:hypothetical protein n=1 Tax=Aidingimonas lacisalsi TaxID=2604086 RepID=UPI0011D196BA|nr:hypothetical protein [Aidingimonas lacisalsi]
MSNVKSGNDCHIGFADLAPALVDVRHSLHVHAYALPPTDSLIVLPGEIHVSQQGILSLPMPDTEIEVQWRAYATSKGYHHENAGDGQRFPSPARGAATASVQRLTS